MIPDVVVEARRKDLRDFKFTFYGNHTTNPLSFRISVLTAGKIVMCQPPNYRKRLPPGFVNLWESNIKIYISSNSIGKQLKSFRFSKDKRQAARLILYAGDFKLYHGYTSFQCISSLEKIPAGDHVLTIVTDTKTVGTIY
jgi:hypothetical protein